MKVFNARGGRTSVPVCYNIFQPPSGFLIACTQSLSRSSSSKPSACGSACAHDTISMRMTSAGNEALSLERADETVERLVHLVPARQRAHALEPAADVREAAIGTADELAGLHHHRAEMVGNGDAIAAHVRVLADDVLVEPGEPALRALEAALDERLLRRGLGKAEIREHLRIHQRVAEVSVELRIEPVHALVHARALLEILGIGGGAGLVGQVL